MKQKTNRLRPLARRSLALAAAVAALAATGAAGASGAAAAGPDDRAAKAAQTRQIASSVLGEDYKITLTAVRSTDDEYAASVRMQVYGHSGGSWKETDRVTVGEPDGWFWYPLGGSGAVCQFSTASTNPAPIDVSLLITPSIGCSAPAHYELRDGKISAG